MTSSCDPQPVPLDTSPQALFASWPTSRPLIALWSAPPSTFPPPPQNPWARWTILTEPVATLRALPSPNTNATTEWLGLPHQGPPPTTDPLAALQWVTNATRASSSTPAPPNTPPFRGGWIGWLGYNLGHHIEPASRAPHPLAADHDDRRWPLFEWHHCPAAYAHDALTGQWWIVGDPAARDLLPQLPLPAPATAPFHLAPLRSGTGREGYEHAVRRAIAHIEAGDVFQVNLAHRLNAPFRGSARSAFLALAATANPWYGAYIERPAIAENDGSRRIIASISPELFLDINPHTGRVTTRPIKGTRRADADAPGSERDLRDSAKDHAELTMIVDLMRNDLGRVCRTGSVTVEDLRTIERHGAAAATGVLHGVATVTATLDPTTDTADLLRATFPPGSVTGAPKIRAMQIIDALERAPRGPYCGAIGYISDSGHAAFNVAIRTACITAPASPPDSPRDHITAGTLDYHAGAGIVADSDPAAEWQETLDKAAAILSLATSLTPPAPTPPNPRPTRPHPAGVPL